MDISRNQESMSDSEICVNWLSAWERRRLIWNLRNSALQDFWENNQNKFSKNSFVPPGISSPEKVSVLTDWFAEHSEHKDLRWCNFLQTCLSFFELDSELCSGIFLSDVTSASSTSSRSVSGFARSHFPLSKKTNKTYLHSSSSYFTLCSSYLLAYKWMAS